MQGLTLPFSALALGMCALPSTCTAAAPLSTGRGKGWVHVQAAQSHSMDPAAKVNLPGNSTACSSTGAMPYCAQWSCLQDLAGINLAAQARVKGKLRMKWETDSKEQCFKNTVTEGTPKGADSEHT